MMHNNDLKFTLCGRYCDFKNITTFCFDCPALLCNSCKELMHKDFKNRSHVRINFNNENLDWNNKRIFDNILFNCNFKEDVYEEVTRSFMKNYTVDSSQIGVITDFGGKRENENDDIYGKLSKKSDENYVKIVKMDSQSVKNEYESKIQNLSKNILDNFIKIDTKCLKHPELPVENIVYCFIKSRSTGSINDWYEEHFGKRINFSIINDIINKSNFQISSNELKIQYNSLAISQNKVLLDKCPDQNLVANLRKSIDLILCEDVNQLNKLPTNILDKLKSTKVADEKLVWNIVLEYEKLKECQKRMLMTELDLRSHGLLDTFISYLKDESLGCYIKEAVDSGNVKLIHVKQAASDNFSIDQALSFLQKSCLLCTEDYPIPEMRELLSCQHAFCKKCIFEWLKDLIETKYPCKWMCPYCDESRYAEVDKNMHYGQLREFLIGDKKLLHLFETKLLQERLMDSPNFHWCANEQCTNGFEAEGVVKIQCPSCAISMCGKCNRKWQEEHDNRTCEEFELWMLKTDTNLSNLLQNIGIECPKCGMRYAFAPGGCLHFDCKACGTKFCGGCTQLFVDKCGKPGCEMTNFHSHHPRNCLYFLRDYSPADLENMLKNSDFTKLENKPEQNCSFMVTDKQYHDHACNVAVHGTTGLCEGHYKEYLVQFINRYQIDPADFANADALNLMLFQMMIPRLEKNEKESDDAFKQHLLQEVKEKCFLYLPNGVQIKDEIQVMQEDKKENEEVVDEKKEVIT